MTLNIDETAKLVSFNIGRDIECAMHKHHAGIQKGVYKDAELEEEITEIFKKQIQPLHNDLRVYIKDSTPPKPKPIYSIIFMGIALGAMATIAIRNKMLHTAMFIMSMWLSMFAEV